MIDFSFIDYIFLNQQQAQQQTTKNYKILSIIHRLLREVALPPPSSLFFSLILDPIQRLILNTQLSQPHGKEVSLPANADELLFAALHLDWALDEELFHTEELAGEAGVLSEEGGQLGGLEAETGELVGEGVGGGCVLVDLHHEVDLI